MGAEDEAVGGDVDSNDSSTAVDGLFLVEDEIAEAVVDTVSAVFFNRLQGVGVVSDDEVGTCIDDTAGEDTLLTDGFQMVFPAPMGHDDDDGC